MDDIRIKKRCIAALKRKVSNSWNLISKNEILSTKVYYNDETAFDSHKFMEGFELEEEELPLLQSILANGNAFLITTRKLISYYQNELHWSYYKNRREYISDEFHWKDEIFKYSTKVSSIELVDGTSLSWEVELGHTYFAIKIIFKELGWWYFVRKK